MVALLSCSGPGLLLRCKPVVYTGPVFHHNLISLSCVHLKMHEANLRAGFAYTSIYSHALLNHARGEEPLIGRPPFPPVHAQYGRS